MTTEANTKELIRAIGKRLQTRRKALGFTQERLAEMAGLSPTYIAKLEAGVKTASLETLISLGAALKMDPGELIRQTEERGDTERVRNLAAAFDGLSAEDVEFAEQELLHLVAYLRHR